MGLVIFAAIGVYLLISVAVIALAIRHARNNNKSAKRWGWSAALVMYLIPLWDWLPTVVTQQYHCARDSGFWIYKSVQQWKTENPGIMEALAANEPPPSKHRGDMTNYVDTYVWNERFNSVIRKSGPFILNVWQHDQEIVDVRTGEVVAKRVDFSTGNGHVGGEPELRFWIHSDHCFGAREKAKLFVDLVKPSKGRKK